MYSTRVICRPQNSHRVAKHAGPACSRNLSTAGFFPTPFIGSARHSLNPFAVASSGFGDFTPVLRLLDESSRAFENFPFGPSARRQGREQHQQQQAFQPRFDVQEVDAAYELRGELPGVESKNLEVEFTDANTLVIRGRTESEHTSGTAPQAIQANADESATIDSANTNIDSANTNIDSANANIEASDAASVHSNGSTSSYVKPTVEDEETAESNATTTTTTVAAPAKAPKSTPQEQPVEQPAQPTSHYWLSECSVGTFQRTFTFSSRIDHDGVTASLNNGILNVTVPKAPEPAARKITVN